MYYGLSSNVMNEKRKQVGKYLHNFCTNYLGMSNPKPNPNEEQVLECQRSFFSLAALCILFVDRQSFWWGALLCAITVVYKLKNSTKYLGSTKSFPYFQLTVALQYSFVTTNDCKLLEQLADVCSSSRHTTKGLGVVDGFS